MGFSSGTWRPDPIQFTGLFERLVRHTVEPDNDQACWLWRGRCTKRYPRINIRVRGKHHQIKPHRAMLVLMEVGSETEHFWDLYELYSYAEFDGDHHCATEHNERCINPDHLQWLTKDQHKEKNERERHGPWRNVP